MAQLGNCFSEGGIYIIHNFSVKPYREDLMKCIKNDKHLWLSNHTTVHTLNSDDRLIPTQEFDFFDYGQKESILKLSENLQLIDVIGVITQVDSLIQTQKSADVTQIYIRFKITNGRSNADLCFWDKCAQEFDQVIRHCNVKPIVLIVASCKINPYRATVQVTIASIENKGRWFSEVCRKCREDIRLINNESFCDNCNRSIPIPAKKFRIEIIVEDESAAAAILLMDREVQKLVGKNVYQLITEAKKQGKENEFPKSILELEGKKITCSVIVCDDNVENQSTLFTATEKFEGFEMKDESTDDEDEITVTGGTSQLFIQTNLSSYESDVGFKTPGTDSSITSKMNSKVKNDSDVTKKNINGCRKLELDDCTSDMTRKLKEVKKKKMNT